MPNLFVLAQIFTLGNADIRDINAMWLTPFETFLLFMYAWYFLQLQQLGAQVWLGWFWWIYLLGGLWVLTFQILGGAPIVSVLISWFGLMP